MIKSCKHFILLIVLVSSTLSAFGQITSSSANYQEPTIYANTTNFFYNTISVSELKGTNAMPGATKCWWNKYDDVSSYEFVKEENSLVSTLSSIVSGGGYEFCTTNGIDTIHYYCWTFEPQVSLDTVFVDNAKITCERMGLQATATTLPLFYRNPANLSEKQMVDYKLKFNWSANPAGGTIPSVWNPTFTQPTEPTLYSAIVEGLGITTPSKSIATTYVGIGLDARIDVTPYKKPASNSVDTMSGPYTVFFKNISKGKSDFEEVLIINTNGDTTRVTYDATAPYTFNKVGTYIVKMSILNTQTDCSSISADFQIKVPGSMLGVPNAFTPNGDGVNDLFKISYASLKKYQIYIYNRWGRLVYSSDDPAGGWDGTAGSSMGSTGVYFYVIEATGVDGTAYNQKGCVHLLGKQ